MMEIDELAPVWTADPNNRSILPDPKVNVRSWSSRDVSLKRKLVSNKPHDSLDIQHLSTISQYEEVVSGDRGNRQDPWVVHPILVLWLTFPNSTWEFA